MANTTDKMKRWKASFTAKLKGILAKKMKPVEEFRKRRPDLFPKSYK